MASEKYPSLSVIVPTYNAKDLLEHGLRSVYSQTVIPDEIIVIDDGSTDNTRLMIQENFPDIIYKYQENRGVAAARNHGADLASGDWLAFLDSDDQWETTKLQEQLEALSRFPHVKMITTGKCLLSNRFTIPNRVFHWRFLKLLRHNTIAAPSVLIERRIFMVSGGFDVHLETGEDWEFWLRMVSQYPVLGMTNRLTRVGKTKGSLSSDRFKIFMNNINVLSRWDPDKNSDSPVTRTVFRRVVWFHTYLSIRRLIKRGQLENALIFWDASKKALPFSRTGRYVLENFLHGRVRSCKKGRKGPSGN